jgi:hypothetical protein
VSLRTRREKWLTTPPQHKRTFKAGVHGKSFCLLQKRCIFDSLKFKAAENYVPGNKQGAKQPASGTILHHLHTTQKRTSKQ